MKTPAKSALLLLLSLWAVAAPAQTTTTTSTNRPTAGAGRIVRFTGIIAAVDAQAKTFTLQSATNELLIVTPATAITKTTITKTKVPGAFDAMSVGQHVSGTKRKDADGKWIAGQVLLGDPRQIPDEPAPKP